MPFNPIKNYRTLRRYQQVIRTVVSFGFGETVGRLDIWRRLRLRRVSVDDSERLRPSRAVRFRMMLEQLGPTFIKVGQILSTRTDLLPPDIIDELTNLQNSVTPLPWDQVEQTLKIRDRVDVDEVFSEFDRTPIASASIAQVYAARLKTGEKVAVKIIRPGTEEIFRDDLTILEHLAGLIHTHITEARHWHPRALVAQVRSAISRELDLQHEARNADIFRANFADDPTVYAPVIHWAYCSRHVMVMEFIDGKPLSEYFGDDVDPQIKKELALNGAKAVLTQIFEHGFFQSDPHPANIFVLPDHRICCLDFGMFGRLDEEALDVLARVLQAVVKRDPHRIIKAAQELTIVPDDVDRVNLRLALLDLLDQYHGLPLKQIDVSRLLRDIIALINQFNLNFRPDFFHLIRALSTIEGSGQKLHAEFDMVSQIEPFVKSLLLKRFAPRRVLNDAQELTEDVLALTRQSPELMLDILRRLRSGRFSLEFHQLGLDEPLSVLNQMSDKLILGLIVAALIIASALMANSKIGPTLYGFPLIGGISFVIAGISGLWIVFDILRSRRKK